MFKEWVKKLTGKNPQEYEQAALHIVNNSDVEAFEYLVSQEDFLFDFIKHNAAKRLKHVVGEGNYLNLLSFMKFYSPHYEETIISSLVKFADEDLTDKMLAKLENGTDAEKTYAAKFFEHIQDPLALNALRQNAFAEYEPLAINAATTLGALKDEKSFDEALEKLNSDDDFEVLSAVRFLSAYGDKKALSAIFAAEQKSPLAENIAAEVPYLESLLDLLATNYDNAILTIKNIVSGLGEVIGLSGVFEFELWEVFEALIDMPLTSKSAITLLEAKKKFDDLTENDEYLYDEDKNTKAEILEIKKLLERVECQNCLELVREELTEESPFVLTAIDLSTDAETLRNLLCSKNQTVVLKTLERLKTLNEMTSEDIDLALKNTQDENIKMVIKAL